MKVNDYTEAALVAHGIPFFERGKVPAHLTRARERAAFEAKWRTLEQRAHGDWFVGGRRIVPDALKMAVIRDAYRDPLEGFISAL